MLSQSARGVSHGGNSGASGWAMRKRVGLTVADHCAEVPIPGGPLADVLSRPDERRLKFTFTGPHLE
jgi:hypothetical protein